MVLDLQGISTFTDFFVICSGTSEPHLKAIAGEVEARLKGDHGGAPVPGGRIPPLSQWNVPDYMQVTGNLSSRQTRVLQPRRLMGRRAPAGLGTSGRTTLAFSAPGSLLLWRGRGRWLDRLDRNGRRWLRWWRRRGRSAWVLFSGCDGSGGALRRRWDRCALRRDDAEQFQFEYQGRSDRSQNLPVLHRRG